jgi:hypothetical protein
MIKIHFVKKYPELLSNTNDNIFNYANASFKHIHKHIKLIYAKKASGSQFDYFR